MSWTCLASCLRRSSVGAGTGMRTSLPSLEGFNPRSAERIAFSIALICVWSHGRTVNICGSGACTEAILFTGLGSNSTFTQYYASDIPLFPHIKHDNRQIVIHAKRDRRGIHHFEPAFEHLTVSDLVVEFSGRVDDRICGVNPVDFRRLENDIGPDLERAQGSR